MKVAIVDIQGFYIQNQMHPKEIAIEISKKTNHYILKAPFSFQTLSQRDRKTTLYTERYHGVKYSSGYIDYNEVNNILLDNLSDIDIIYIRGQQKTDFLLSKAWELNLKANMVNIEKFDCSTVRFGSPPKIEATETPQCLNHTFLPARCAINNCEAISRWIYGLLPL